MGINIPQTLAEWNAAGAAYLPGYLGLTFLKVEPQEVIAKLTARKELGAWNGYLHAGAVVTLADTCCGYGTVCSLPAGATGFTTVELLRQRARGRRRLRRAPAASGPHHAGLGRDRDRGGLDQADRPVPQHTTDPMAEGLIFTRHPGRSNRAKARSRRAGILRQAMEYAADPG
jgi:1,4-dihydroxy-2-naphthoyl-CoA hydrolase